MEASHDHTSNLILAALPPADLARLRPHLNWTDLKLRQELERPNKPIETIYFMCAGFASVVATQAGAEEAAEIGLVGHEGMTGSAVLLGNGQSPHFTYVQMMGAAERIATSELQKAMAESATLHRVLLKYVLCFTIQTAHTAIANARAKLPERLARWILMAQDRARGNTLVLTHEFLGLMLAVRRAGVTEALQSLQRRKLIKSGRGTILVLDRKGLEGVAGNFYGVPEKEYRRMFG